MGVRDVIAHHYFEVDPDAVLEASDGLGDDVRFFRIEGRIQTHIVPYGGKALPGTGLVFDEHNEKRQDL